MHSLNEGFGGMLPAAALSQLATQRASYIPGYGSPVSFALMCTTQDYLALASFQVRELADCAGVGGRGDGKAIHIDRCWTPKSYITQRIPVHLLH